MISLKEQIECAERELEKRRRLYPRWIKAGDLNELKAEREIAGMEAIIRTLESLVQPDLPGPSPGTFRGP
jgi:hypothetical protein